MSSSKGLDNHFVGERVTDEDYGNGVIIAILPPNPIFPSEYINELADKDFIVSRFKILFDDEIERVVASCCVESLEVNDV